MNKRQKKKVEIRENKGAFALSCGICMFAENSKKRKCARKELGKLWEKLYKQVAYE